MEGERVVKAEVREASVSDEAQVVQTIVLAFSSDPMMRWCWPQAHRYLEVAPAFVRAFGGRAFHAHRAYCTAGFEAAALWLPPGVEPDAAAMGAIMERSAAPEVLDDVHELVGQMAQYHPQGPHWYLPLIGVDPAHQGRGHGSAVLAHALRECDRDGRPAYLESSNLRNVVLYQRHGFRVIGEIQAGRSPTMVAMLRAPGA